MQIYNFFKKTLDISNHYSYNNRVANEYSSIAQSVERMTVNHDVVGSSPTGGAKQKKQVLRLAFFVWLFHFNPPC